MKCFIFWFYHVVLRNDVLCGGFCPTCGWYEKRCRYECGEDWFQKERVKK